MTIDINPEKLASGSPNSGADMRWDYSETDVLRSEAVRFVFHAQGILRRRPPAPPLTLEECLSVREEVFWKGDRLRDVDWTSGDRLEALEEVISWQGTVAHGQNGPVTPSY